MGLKYQIASLNDVPENVRPLYKAEGNVFVLDAEGVVPSSRLDEFRNNNIRLQQEIDRFKGIDPTKHAELIEIQRKIAEKELVDKGDVEGLVSLRVNTMKQDLEGQLKTAKEGSEAATRQLSQLLILDAVKSAGIANGALPSALDDLALRANLAFVVENGVPVMKQDGKIVYGKDAQTPMTPTEWVIGLRKTAPHLFQGFNGSGAGGGTGRGKVDTANMTPLEKINAGLAGGGTLGNLPGATS
jgi:hypothetical protein